jgi:hypothetical protein
MTGYSPKKETAFGFEVKRKEKTGPKSNKTYLVQICENVSLEVTPSLNPNPMF